MSIASMVLGQSGTGKTTSLRNMTPADVLLIQAVKKPLPFRSKEWVPCTKGNPSGSILVPSPKGDMDGSMVGQAVADGRLLEVVEYCKRDIRATREVYQRMTFAEADQMRLAA